MNLRTIVAVMMFFSSITISHAMHLNIKPAFGFTAVDVEQATHSTLEDWDTYAYGAVLQGLFAIGPRWQLGPEIGINRLYYWEEKYFVFLPSATPRWRWGTISTVHVGAIIQKQLAGNLYLQGGAGFHVFLDGSGLTPGLALGLGYALPVSRTITIPIELRSDFIFGNNTPITLRVISGIGF